MKLKTFLRFVFGILLTWIGQAWLLNPARASISPIDLVISVFLLPGYLLMFFLSRKIFHPRKGWFLNGIILILLAILSSALTYFLTNQLDLSQMIGFYFVSPFLAYELFLIHIFWGLLAWASTSIQSAFDKVQLENQLERIKLQQTEAREKNLVSRLQPHFLFNALNTIYALARKQDPETADTVLQLSDLLRYSVDTSNHPKTSLKKEIRFIEDYCKFQDKRLSKHIQLKLDLITETEETEVPPLLFQPLIENAFKYVNQEKDGEMCISLHQKGKHLTFLCSNPSYSEENLKTKNQDGTGLSLVKQRLETLYSDKATFEIRTTFPIFEVYCEITL